MRLGDVARLGEEQRHRLLGRREDIRLRCIDDHHAALGGRGDVHVVEPDAGPADDDQIGAGGQHLGGDGGRRTDDERLRAGHRGNQLFRRETQPDVHLVARLLQAVEPGWRQLFGHEHPSHGFPFCRCEEICRW